MEISSVLPSRRRAVTLNFIAQLVGYAFVVIQGIFLVPLYLRFIAVPLYGAWLASTQVVGWVTLLDPGTDEVTRQRAAAHAYGSGKLEQVGGLIGSGFVVNLIVAACVTIVSLLLSQALPWWFGMSGPNGRQLVIASSLLALASGMSVVAYIAGSSLQALQCTGTYGIVLILGNVAGLGLNLKLLHAGLGPVRNLSLVSLQSPCLGRGLGLHAVLGVPVQKRTTRPAHFFHTRGPHTDSFSRPHARL